MILEVAVVFVIGELFEGVVAGEEARGDEWFRVAQGREPRVMKPEEWDWGCRRRRKWREAVTHVAVVKLEGLGPCYKKRRCTQLWIAHCRSWGIAVMLCLCFRGTSFFTRSSSLQWWWCVSNVKKEGVWDSWVESGRPVLVIFWLTLGLGRITHEWRRSGCYLALSPTTFVIVSTTK